MIAKLEMLLALAKEQHFGRAAQALGITQPSLSAGIRQLEGQLGVKLVHRGSRFKGLTPEGQRALVWARQIVGDTRRLRDEMRQSKQGLAGHVRIAVIPTALTWAAHVTAAFSDKHPKVSFSILSRTSIEVLSMLENLDADAGITYLDNEPLGRMAQTPLYREHYMLLCRPDHDLATRDQVSWEDLAGLRMCLLTPDMQNRRIINQNFMSVGIEPAPMVESNSTIVLASHVIEGGFVTILPADMARYLSAGKDLSIVPISEDGFVPTVGLISTQQEPFTPVLGALMRQAAGLARL